MGGSKGPPVSSLGAGKTGSDSRDDGASVVIDRGKSMDGLVPRSSYINHRFTGPPASFLFHHSGGPTVYETGTSVLSGPPHVSTSTSEPPPQHHNHHLCDPMLLPGRGIIIPSPISHSVYGEQTHYDPAASHPEAFFFTQMSPSNLQPRPPAPAPPPHDKKMIEVSPGCLVPLRGAEETLECIERGFFAPCQCLGCMTEDILCIQDADFVLCPDCRVVSPMKEIQDDMEEKKQFYGGVGLGFTDELVNTFMSELSAAQTQPREQHFSGAHAAYPQLTQRKVIVGFCSSLLKR